MHISGYIQRTFSDSLYRIMCITKFFLLNIEEWIRARIINRKNTDLLLRFAGIRNINLAKDDKMQKLLELPVFSCILYISVWFFSVHFNNMLGICHFYEYFAFDMSSKIEDGKLTKIWNLANFSDTYNCSSHFVAVIDKKMMITITYSS